MPRKSSLKRKEPRDPYQVLVDLVGPVRAPTRCQLDLWKMVVPHGRLRLFMPNDYQAFIVRAVRRRERGRYKRDELVSRCCLWTNATRENVLTAEFMSTHQKEIQNLFTLVARMSQND